MGTAEQEQKGVNMPSTAERGIARALCLVASDKGDNKDDQGEQCKDL
jgi:hypothetical protein